MCHSRGPTPSRPALSMPAPRRRRLQHVQTARRGPPTPQNVQWECGRWTGCVLAASAPREPPGSPQGAPREPPRSPQGAPREPPGPLKPAHQPHLPERAQIDMFHMATYGRMFGMSHVGVHRFRSSTLKRLQVTYTHIQRIKYGKLNNLR